MSRLKMAEMQTQREEGTPITRGVTTRSHCRCSPWGPHDCESESRSGHQMDPNGLLWSGAERPWAVVPPVGSRRYTAGEHLRHCVASGPVSAAVSCASVAGSSCALCSEF